MSSGETLDTKEDFYVEPACCTACGVPQHYAPTMIGWTATETYPTCKWIRQPESLLDFAQIYEVFDNQELGCHRYRGTDPAIQARVGYENCDAAPSEGSGNFRGRLAPFSKAFWNRMRNR